MNTLLGIIWAYFLLVSILLSVACVLAIPVALLAFGLGATLQGVALAAATPFVLAVIGPLVVLVGLWIIDGIQVEYQRMMRPGPRPWDR